jgi:hypothetical protein
MGVRRSFHHDTIVFYKLYDVRLVILSFLYSKITNLTLESNNIMSTNQGYFCLFNFLEWCDYFDALKEKINISFMQWLFWYFALVIL